MPPIRLCQTLFEATHGGGRARFFVLTYHRFRACQELDIEPRTEVRRFADTLLEKKFVIEANLKRRHLNDFQRIELALKLKPIYEELARKNSAANLPTVKSFTVEEEVPKLERVNNVIASKASEGTMLSF